MLYQEVLDTYTRFMEETMIRRYCTEVCKGRCCSNFPEDYSCMDSIDCHNRLACTVHLCEALRPDKYTSRYIDIVRRLKELLPDEQTRRDAMYLDDIDQSSFEGEEFNVPDPFEEYDVESIKEVMGEAIENEIPKSRIFK